MRQSELLLVEDLLQVQTKGSQEASSPLERAFEALGVCAGASDRFAESLPFSANDATAGSETELQAAVIGGKDVVDLPLALEHSNYFSNILRRIAAGDTPRSMFKEPRWQEW